MQAEGIFLVIALVPLFVTTSPNDSCVLSAVQSAIPEKAREGVLTVTITRHMPDRASRFSVRRGSAVALVALGMAFPLPPMQDVSLDAFAAFTNSSMRSNVHITRSPRGIELDVNGPGIMILPFPGAVEVVFDCIADGLSKVSWASELGIGQPPSRYRPLGGGPARLRLNMLEVAKWEPWVRPVLLFDGSAHIAITRIQVRLPSNNPYELQAAYDRAMFWASESIGHTTINFLTPSVWSTKHKIFLQDILAAGALIIFTIVLIGIRIARCRWRPGVALALAAFFAVAASNAHFLVRFLPAANLSLPSGPDERIRDNYYFAPEFGAIAALARATLRYDETVGVVGAPENWFAPQTMCFNLAPRPCVIVKPNETEYTGISGVGRLHFDNLDAIISFYAQGPLPPGFVPITEVSPRVFIARRR